MNQSPSVKKIVLLVDDDPDVLKVIKSQLEYEGYAVLMEQTGEAAIEAVRRVKLMAVLLDLGLVGMGGFEVLSRIKQIKPEVPVMIVTGCHNENEARKSFEMGAWDYITKPIDFKYLKNVLLIQSQQAS